MKKHLHSITGLIFLLISGTASLAQVPMLPQTVVMGPGYANEVYYQFTTFNTYETPRTSWDLSFNTSPESGSILINDGNLTTLWSYPWGDTTAWATLDTFLLYTYPLLYNDPDEWNNGAFNRTSTGYPNYGWGSYNQASQVITGDSLYIIQLADGSYKKIWIVKKNTAENSWLFRYANLDGSDSQEVSFDCDPYTGKDLVGFNLQTNLPVDYRPVKESWDILFTKYMAWHPTGAPVVVTGVLSNPAIVAKKFYPVDPDFNDWQSAPWDSSRSTIGWDWKWFDLGSFTYSIVDSMVFYVKEQAGNVYRLKFTGFEGTSTGVIDFGIALVLGVGIDDGEPSEVGISLWPNPAKDLLNVSMENGKSASGMNTVSILDMAGRTVMNKRLPPGQDHVTWNISELSPGPYLLEVRSGNDRLIGKFFKL